MKCEEVMELMQRSLDGDLDSAETSRMMEHIQTCPECAAMFDRLTRLSANLAQLPRVTPGFSIVDSILPQLEKIELDSPAPLVAAETGSKEGELLPRTPRSARRTYRRVAGAIVAGVAAGLLIVAWPSLQSSQSNQNQSFDAASMSGSGSASSSASPSAEANEQQSVQSYDLRAAQKDKAAGSSPKADIAQPSAGTESDTPELKSIAPDEDSTVDGSASQQESADSASPDSEPQSSEQYKPMTSLVAPEGGDASGAEDAPSGEPAATPATPTSSAMMIAPPSVWNSPDGKYRAAVEDKRLKVYQASDDKLVFESGEHPDSALTDVVWDDDSAVLHYTWTDASGHAVKLEWTAATGQESTDAADTGKSGE